MKKLFVIKAGSTFEDIIKHYGDFEDWIIQNVDNKNIEIQIIDVTKNQEFPSLEQCAGIIISGSHAMVSDEEPWSLKIEKWIPLLEKEKIPTLGICYGHQLLAKALGGVSGYHENGMEIGTVELELTKEAKEDMLFNSLNKNFKAHTVHSQTVFSLPKNAVRLAFNEHDKNHAFRLEENIWGVQFHPEYDENIMKSYISEVAKIKDIKKENLISKVEDTLQANLILKKFGEIVEKKVKND